MFRKLRLRLTFFIICVIGVMLVLLALAILTGSSYVAEQNDIRKHELTVRIIFSVILCLVFVFFGSLFISGRVIVPIKKAWQKQVDFTADASHELRTPLAVIQTNLELVMGNPDETVESQNKWLENMLNESKRMSKLIDDLLTLSRSDANQQTLEMNRFMLDEALHEAVDPYKPIAAAQGMTLEHNSLSGVEFIGDRNRIKQLIIILIDNALKYTGNGGRIEVVMKRRDKHVEIAVEDTGVGIEKEHLSRIFDRFYRVDKARSRNKGGSGLGLAIAKWIVDEHKGQIKVESTPGKGTRFTVLLQVLDQK
ncbi:MAG: HAMP domain-containing histidine kinase [Clostridia bacterium]|nr:HAMP domain-containing histidine kinase [Clostridia bacterium]